MSEKQKSQLLELARDFTAGHQHCTSLIDILEANHEHLDMSDYAYNSTIRKLEKAADVLTHTINAAMQQIEEINNEPMDRFRRAVK